MSLGPLMIDLRGKSIADDEREWLESPLVGGVILFTRNFENAEQLKKLVADIHAVRQPPLLVTVDQEGGRVQRFRQPFFKLPPLRALGRLYDEQRDLALRTAGAFGWLMAAELRAVGVDLSFAPCVELDRGLAYAIAHVRGGDELGEGWHDDGMLMKKKNTFYDFIDCAQYLVSEKWTSPDRLLIEGGSAGGLLMGAVVNERPDLFRAAHLAVPFVDVINTMMDASLPLTIGEYLEWGNPNEKPAFDYMLSYSPYDNLARKAYPALLVTTSYNDSQVMYWEPAKYVAKLRTLKTDSNPLVLKTKMQPAGHGGASGRYDALKDRAFEVAWMLRQVGITE